jgi:hypothetical protein
MQTATATIPKYEVLQDRESPSDWRVEATDIKAGDVFIAIFSGPDSEARAAEYAKFKNQS